MPSIKDMIDAMDNSVSSKKLFNTVETWERLNAGDKFSELGLSPSEFEDMKKDFYAKNDYSAIA